MLMVRMSSFFGGLWGCFLLFGYLDLTIKNSERGGFQSPASEVPLLRVTI